MGGSGSGGSNRLTDEEKKKRGTFRASRAEDVYEARAAAKVIAGPWLTVIPEPEYKLSEVGRSKYDEIAKELLEQNKLTKISVMNAAAFALFHQKFHALAEAGKYPSAHDVSRYQSLLRDLNVATHAKVTAAPGGQKNKFAFSGFSNSRVSEIRLRPAAARTRKS